MATVQAPRRAPVRLPSPARPAGTGRLRVAPAPRRDPQRRPPLRVVREPARHPNYAALSALGLGAVFVVLFGLVVFHTVLLQNQRRLDQLDARVQDEQARYQQLRLEVAQLSSPQRIVDVATQKLGLVPSDGTTYLTPSGADAAAARATRVTGTTGQDSQDGAANATAGAETAATAPVAGGTSWPQVKPYLGAAP